MIYCRLATNSKEVKRLKLMEPMVYNNCSDTIPMLKPTFFLLITTIINSFKVFGQVKIMTAGVRKCYKCFGLSYLYVGIHFYNMGYASAMSWVLFIILLR